MTAPTSQAQITALGHKFGLKPSPAAERSKAKQFVVTGASPLPMAWDIRTDGATAKALPPDLPLDQGALDTCVPNALAAAAQWLTGAGTLQSRLYSYYYGRAINGLQNSDGGSVISSVLQSASTRGVCYESGANAWPYVAAEVNAQPPVACDAIAATDILGPYSAITLGNVAAVKNALHCGYPVMAGIYVYPGFETLVNYVEGKVPMFSEKAVSIGAHCILIIGYDAPTKLFTFLNSWGSGYGKDGVGTIPFAYIKNIVRGCFDLWAIEGVTV